MQYTTKQATADAVLRRWRQSPTAPVIISQALGWWSTYRLKMCIKKHLPTGTLVQIDKLVMGERKTLTGVRIMVGDNATTAQL